MLASFKASELVPFAVLAEKTDENKEAAPDESDNDRNKDTEEKTDENKEAEIVDVPKTGDNSNLLVWGILLIAAVFSQGIVIAFRRKKGK